MLNAATLKGKMGLLPDPQIVTVNFKNRTTPLTLTVDGARRRPVSAAEIAFTAQAGFGIPTSQFLLAVANMNGNVLKQGDEIVESATDSLSGAALPWNVLRADLELQGTIWRAFVSQE